MKHSHLLSPSGSHIWMHCAGSSHAQLHMPDFYSKEAVEGTAVHELAYMSDQLNVSPYFFFSKTLSGVEITEDHCFDVQEYLSLIKRQCDTFKLEHRIELPHLHSSLFGTTDAYGLRGSTLNIYDLKYGHRDVSVVANPSLWIYTLGVMEEVTPTTVNMTIYQPRCEKIIKTISVAPEQILKWGRTILPAAIKKATDPHAPRMPGNHCKLCKAKITCPEYLEYCGYNIEPPMPLTEEFIGNLLTRAPSIKKLIENAETIGTEMLLRGLRVPGCKLVKRTTHRRLKNREKVVNSLIENGVEKDAIYKSTLRSPNDIKKQIDKSLHDIIDDNTYKPEGNKTIALLEDNRIAVASSRDIFK